MPLNHKKVSTIFSPVFFAFRGSFANFGADIEFFSRCYYIINNETK